jgi:hypothetical protein
MKGIVFTELIDMVEQEIGLETADRMISSLQSPHAGAYTSVGSYDHTELISMVVALSNETGIAVPTLVQTFGRHLFKRFHALYPQFFQHSRSATEFLASVEAHIHVEVRKLYPDAELPTFECATTNGVFRMTYRSGRPFADLAQGLILACVDHFGDECDVTREDLDNQDGTAAIFVLTPRTSDVESEREQPCPT